MSTERYNPGTASRKLETKTPPLKFIFPLLYAPILPLIRLALRKKPDLRDRVFAVSVGAAFLHGVYLISDCLEEKKVDV